MAIAVKSARVVLFGSSAANVDSLKAALNSEGNPNVSGVYSSNVSGGSLAGFVGAAGVLYTVTLMEEDPTGVAVDAQSLQNILSSVLMALPGAA